MMMSARRYEAKAVPGARPDRRRADPGDRRRIDFLFVAIAVDDGSRNMLDDRTESGGDRPPAEPVDERILQHFQGPSSV
jgi:hypothetical protein